LAPEPRADGVASRERESGYPDRESDWDEPPRRRPAPRYEDEDEEYGDRPRRRRRRRADLAEHRGNLILALGIASLAVCALIGPAAWILGHNDLKEMRAGRMDPEGESNTRIGMILGMVATILSLVGVLLICVLCGGIIVAPGAR
jgi:hypothetical protein